MVKEELKKELSEKVKDIYGHNGDFEIDNGEIIYVFQKTDNKTGRRKENVYKKGIKADEYFDKIKFLILSTTYRFIKEKKIDIAVHFSFIGDNYLQITIE